MAKEEMKKEVFFKIQSLADDKDEDFDLDDFDNLQQLSDKFEDEPKSSVKKKNCKKK